MDVAVKYAVSCIIDQELEYAYKKHPEFPKGFEGTVIILEELGELAKESTLCTAVHNRLPCSVSCIE